ncbi:nucleotidyltransferase domain-containing protein [Planococcus sp. YIM B11945]|uniref:nucleotidyltransferase domain-containing protein n=1 Tax=Planococcus sp. YIM B11945 TaxID=3435410 RepID=UPI003D7E34B6
MNIHSKWRLTIAQNLTKQLSHYPGVRAIVVGGSAARNYADSYSDLELFLYWDKDPGMQIKQEISSKLKADHRYPETHSSYHNALIIDGFPVDIWYKVSSIEEASFASVVDDASIDLDASNIVDTMRFCIPLYGRDYIQPWKNRVENYPLILTERFFNDYLPHFHLRHIYFEAKRDNPTAFYNMLSNIQCSLFILLLALNKSYFPTYKWIYKRLNELELKPENIEVRLQTMFKEPPEIAVKQLRDVLAETLTLIEAHHPNFDTTIARQELLQPMPKAYGPVFTQ